MTTITFYYRCYYYREIHDPELQATPSTLTHKTRSPVNSISTRATPYSAEPGPVQSLTFYFVNGAPAEGVRTARSMRAYLEVS